jgi:murein DD-endopeptidase MepM/ murein hydrolase activator NlpD
MGPLLGVGACCLAFILAGAGSGTVVAGLQVASHPVPTEVSGLVVPGDPLSDEPGDPLSDDPGDPLSDDPGQRGPKPRWSWPVTPRPAVVRRFSPPPQPWLSGHRGVDLDAPGGTEVLSPADGVISFVGWVVDRPVLAIAHADGRRSSLEPVTTTLEEGAVVRKGEAVGRLDLDPAEAGGAPARVHCAPAACLHWGVREGVTYVDPLQFILDLRPSVLLPLHGSAPDPVTAQLFTGMQKRR